MDKDEKCLIEVMSGAEGPSVYINEYRVAGPKPWGGGQVLHRFVTTKEDIENGVEEEFPGPRK